MFFFFSFKDYWSYYIKRAASAFTTIALGSALVVISPASILVLNIVILSSFRKRFSFKGDLVCMMSFLYVRSKESADVEEPHFSAIRYFNSYTVIP